MNALRLTIEPLPQSSRLATLAKLLPSEAWNRIRREAYRSACNTCQACGGKGRMHAHEVWTFNQERGIRSLCGVQALCEKCHAVRHILFVRNTAERERLLAHYMTVNHLSREEAEGHLTEARSIQRQLNQRQWTISFGAYSYLVPPANDLEQRRAYDRFYRPRYQT